MTLNADPFDSEALISKIAKVLVVVSHDRDGGNPVFTPESLKLAEEIAAETLGEAGALASGVGAEAYAHA